MEKSRPDTPSRKPETEYRNLDFYRQRRLEKRQQRQNVQFKQMGIAAAAAVFVIILIIVLISRPTIAKIGTPAKVATTHHLQEKVVMATADNLKLYLPIARDKLTAIGYHEAWSPQSVILEPKGTEVNTKKLKTLKGFLETKEKYKGLIYSLMWRGYRSGPIRSSIDVGAKAGTLTYSPIGGKVVMIRKYKLYGRYPDNEVHILPEGFKDRHLIIIHVYDIKVKPGDKVVAGLTPIARITKFSKVFKQQLSDYSKEAGDHAHYQINKLVNGKCIHRN